MTPRRALFGAACLALLLAATVGAAPIPSTGLELWLQGDTGVTLDGSSRVQRWDDQSGNGYYAEQTSASARPYPTGVSPTGVQTINFVGGDYYLGVKDSGGADLKLPAGPKTMFVMNTGTRLAAGNRAPTTQRLYAGMRDTSALWVGLGATSLARSPHSLDPADYHTYEIMVDTEAAGGGGTGRMYADGVQYWNSTFGGKTATQNAVDIGRAGGAGNESLNGQLAEVIIYNRTLSDLDRLQVETYLENKYITGDVPIDGLDLWLRSDRGVVTSGGAVTLWHDMSGNERHATQASAGQQPTLSGTSPAGATTVRFDGGDFLEVQDPNDPSGLYKMDAGAKTMFVIAQGTGLPAANRGNVSPEPSNTQRFYAGINPSSDNKPWAGLGGSNFTVGVPHSTTAYHIYSLFDDGGNQGRLFVDGVAQYSAALSGSTATTYAVNVGRAGGTGNINFTGDIAEVLIYDGALSEPQRKQVETYLHSKYAVSTAPITTKTLELWLQADQGLGLDTSGRVAQWWDMSGNGRHAVQSSSSSRPSLTGTTPAGTPILHFDGGDFLETTDLNDPSGLFKLDGSPKTLIVLGKGEGLIAGNRGITSQRFYAGIDSASDKGWYGLGISNSTVGAALDTEAFHIFALLDEGGNQGRLLVDGTAVFDGGFGGTTLTDVAFDIGRAGGGMNVTFNGDIAEVLLFDGVLSASELQEVRSYLYAKYNLPEPATLGLLGAGLLALARRRRRT